MLTRGQFHISFCDQLFCAQRLRSVLTIMTFGGWHTNLSKVPRFSLKLSATIVGEIERQMFC